MTIAVFQLGGTKPDDRRRISTKSHDLRLAGDKFLIITLETKSEPKALLRKLVRAELSSAAEMGELSGLSITLAMASLTRPSKSLP